MIDGSDGADYRIEVDRTSPDGSTTSAAIDDLRVEKGELITLPLESWTTDIALDALIRSATGADRVVGLNTTSD